MSLHQGNHAIVPTQWPGDIYLFNNVCWWGDQLKPPDMQEVKHTTSSVTQVSVFTANCLNCPTLAERWVKDAGKCHTNYTVNTTCQGHVDLSVTPVWQLKYRWYSTQKPFSRHQLPHFLSFLQICSRPPFICTRRPTLCETIKGVGQNS